MLKNKMVSYFILRIFFILFLFTIPSIYFFFQGCSSNSSDFLCTTRGLEYLLAYEIFDLRSNPIFLYIIDNLFYILDFNIPFLKNNIFHSIILVAGFLFFHKYLKTKHVIRWGAQICWLLIYIQLILGMHFLVSGIISFILFLGAFLYLKLFINKEIVTSKLFSILTTFLFPLSDIMGLMFFNSKKSEFKKEFKEKIALCYFIVLSVVSLVILIVPKNLDIKPMEFVELKQQYDGLIHYEGENNSGIYYIGMGEEHSEGKIWYLPTPFNDLNKSEVIYTAKRINEYIVLNSERKELYTINRESKELVAIDLNSHKIKYKIFNEHLDEGDCTLSFDDKNIYILTENTFLLVRVNIDKQKVDLVKKHQNEQYNEFSDITYYNGKLFASDWLNENGKYYIWEINPQDLTIVKKSKRLKGTGWELETYANNNELFVTVVGGISISGGLASDIDVYDTETLNLKYRLDVPYLTRAMAFDKNRKILFAGSSVTSFVTLIDLKTKKKIATYRAGVTSLRKITVDSEHRTFFVTTAHHGLYKANY